MKHSTIMAATLLSAVAFGCNKAPEPRGPTALVASPRTPAAQGEVKVDDAGNGNTAVSVTVKHLAPAERMAAGATTYVVWVQPPNGQAQNLGALRIDRDLNGGLSTITPMRDFDIFVTPEPSATSPQPTGERVLFTHINRD